MKNLDDMRTTCGALDRLHEEMVATLEELDVINRQEVLFQWQVSVYPVLPILFQAKEPYAKLWSTAYEFAVKSEMWMNGWSVDVVSIELTASMFVSAVRLSSLLLLSLYRQ